MDLFEYKAMELFRNYGLPVPPGAVAESPEEAEAAAEKIGFPLVVKAQVQTGGRGKAGGIRTAADMTELKEASRAILGMNIKGHIAKKILLAKKVAVRGEWYFSIILDRLAKTPALLFSESGGMDIEEAARRDKNAVRTLALDPEFGLRDYAIRHLVRNTELPRRYAGKLYEFAEGLYRLYREKDCTLVEINPLGVGPEGDLVALDGKISIDDSALYRHPDLLSYRDTLDEHPLVKKARGFNFLFIPCEPGGTVAVTSNGSGMIMSCIDLLSKAGVKTGAALDLGGGATADRIKEAVKILFESEGIKTLFISIFGGITRCDEVAKGVVMGLEGVGADRTVVIRIEGTNKDKGLDILKSIGGRVVTVDSITEGVREIAGRPAPAGGAAAGKEARV
jgi:succinyl-CoA synthetase beta subunit